MLIQSLLSVVFLQNSFMGIFCFCRFKSRNVVVTEGNKRGLCKRDISSLLTCSEEGERVGQERKGLNVCHAELSLSFSWVLPSQVHLIDCSQQIPFSSLYLLFSCWSESIEEQAFLSLLVLDSFFFRLVFLSCFFLFPLSLLCSLDSRSWRFCHWWSRGSWLYTSSCRRKTSSSPLPTLPDISSSSSSQVFCFQLPVPQLHPLESVFTTDWGHKNIKKSWRFEKHIESWSWVREESAKLALWPNSWKGRLWLLINLRLKTIIVTQSRLQVSQIC